MRKAAIVCALVLPLAAQAPVSDVVDMQVRARAAMESGAYTDAEKLYEQALELRKQAFGENSAPCAAALVDLARAYQADRKRSAQAVQYYRQALPIQEATLGPNHPDVATTLYFLALDAQSHKQPDQALELYRRALDIRTKAYGASDERVAQILTPMAVLTGDETTYQRSLAILDASGNKSSDLATTLELYAEYLGAHDRGGEGDSLKSRAREIRVTRVAAIGARRGPVRSAQTMRVSKADGVTPPTLAQKTEPEYSDMARVARYQGTVVLSIVVDADGVARDIQLKRGAGMGLDEKAAEALARWVFHPGTKDGQPVAVAATVEVNFRLL